MAASAMAWISVLLFLPLAGCLSPGRPGNDGSEAREMLTSERFAEATASDGVTISIENGLTRYHIRVDGAELADRVVQFAIQALEDSKGEAVFLGTGHVPWIAGACAGASSTLSAPFVEELLDGTPGIRSVPNGSFDGPASYSSAYSMKASTGTPTVRASMDGAPLFEEALPLSVVGGFSWQIGGKHASEPTVAIERGRWVLVQAFASGIPGDNTAFEAEISWIGSGRIVRLPDGQMHCGSGWATLEGETVDVGVGGTAATIGGRFAMRTQQASLIMFEKKGAPVRANGEIRFGSETFDLAGGQSIACAFSNTGDAEVLLQEWVDTPFSPPFWMFGDVWFPSNALKTLDARPCQSNLA